VGYNKSYQKNEKSPPKVAWLWSCDLFKFLVPAMISPEWLKLETAKTSNLYAVSPGDSLALGLQTPLIGQGQGHVTSLNFRK